MGEWEYLSYLDSGPHVVRLTTSNLAPRKPKSHPESVKICLGYTLWPFQQKNLAEMSNSTLILGRARGP